VSYADDAYVVVSANNHSELESSFKSVLNKHLEWLKENGMVCNVMKTELMVLGEQKIRIERWLGNVDRFCLVLGTYVNI